MTDVPPPPGGFPPPPPPQQPGGFPAPPPPPGTWQAPPPPGAWQGPPPTPYGAANPYGYAAAAPVPPTMRSLGGLATALTILLAIVALVDIVAAGALFDRASLLDDPSPSFGELLDADDRVGAAVGSHLFGVVVVGIVWVIWQFRFVKNVEGLRRPTGFSPGFAIGGWFIPIGNLFIPQQQLAVSARSSDPNAVVGGGSTPGVIYGWWATFVGMTILQAIGSGSRPGDDDVFSSTTVSDFQNADQMHGLGLALGAVCAVLAILTVRACTKRQQQLLVGLSAQAYGQPPGPQPGGPGTVTF